MARRRPRRRPGAGPPPTPARREQAPPAKKKGGGGKVQRRPGEPKPPSFRNVMLRAGIVAALFFPFLIVIGDESPAASLLISVAAIAIMLPLGMLLERLRYRMELKRYKRAQSGSR